MVKDDLTEFLRGAKADYAIRKCEIEIAELEARCTKATAAWSEAPGGGSGDPHKDSGMISLAMKRDELEALKRERESQPDKVVEFLNQIPDFMEREVLRLRYVKGLSWQDVYKMLCAYGWDKSERQMYNLHGNALQTARRLWNDD